MVTVIAIVNNLLKINLLLIIMPHEPLSEDNTSCEEEIINQRYKKKSIIKDNNNISLKKPENTRISTLENKQINNKRNYPVIKNTTLLLLRR